VRELQGITGIKFTWVENDEVEENGLDFKAALYCMDT